MLAKPATDRLAYQIHYLTHSYSLRFIIMDFTLISHRKFQLMCLLISAGHTGSRVQSLIRYQPW